MASTSSSSAPSLYFQSLNPSCEETILLLHSGYNSHREYALVAPHLSSYHLLIPDLPQHGRSTSRTIPFSPSDTAALLADLITKNSKSGKAHLVGVSFGGYIALYLASKYPDVVENVFVSGCGSSFGNDSIFMRCAGAFFLGGFFPTVVLCIAGLPPSWFRWIYGRWGLSVPEGLQEDQWAGAGYGIGFALAAALLRGYFEPSLAGKVRARTMIVAAAKDDDVEGTRTMGVVLRKGNGESKAAKIEGMKHVWSLQDGELFAKCAKAWFEHGRIADELEGL